MLRLRLYLCSDRLPNHGTNVSLTDTCGAAVADYTENARMYPQCELISTVPWCSFFHYTHKSTHIPVCASVSKQVSVFFLIMWSEMQQVVAKCASVWRQVSVYFFEVCRPKCDRLWRNTLNLCRQNRTCHHFHTDVDWSARSQLRANLAIVLGASLTIYTRRTSVRIGFRSCHNTNYTTSRHHNSRLQLRHFRYVILPPALITEIKLSRWMLRWRPYWSWDSTVATLFSIT
jgi:hypothetical protein